MVSWPEWVLSDKETTQEVVGDVLEVADGIVEGVNA